MNNQNENTPTHTKNKEALEAKEEVMLKCSLCGKKLFVNVPVGIARFRFEEPFPPRKYIERGFNIQHWSDFPDGGHFPAMEKPEILAGDICDFFNKFK